MYDEYPFMVDFISVPEEIETTFNELDAKNYGMMYNHVYRDIVIKVSAITLYQDGYKSINTINFPHLQGDLGGSLDGSIFKDNFKANEHGKPKYIEFIISPTRCYPCKWAIKIKE